MNISVTAKNLRQGGDVLTLLNAFQAAGTSIDDMMAPLVMIDPNEIARYRNTDQVPIRIGSKFYPVLELAGGALMGIVIYLTERMASERVELVIPTTTLLNIVVQARRRQTTIRLRVAGPDDIEVSGIGIAPQKFHPAAVFAAMSAMGLSLDDIGRLDYDDFLLVPA